MCFQIGLHKKSLLVIKWAANMKLLPFPNAESLETRTVLKHASEAHRYLAELKGIALSIPNESILINSLTLREAKDSSEIENIVTTHDELYKANVVTEKQINAATKEVKDYAAALRQGFHTVRSTGLIRIQDIVDIQSTLEKNNAGFRRLPGTDLKNVLTGEVIYTPPQKHDEIQTLMANLVGYINDGNACDLDPLVKMAIIHHQFESIHPFYDGNGRTGRMINVLYMVAQGLLDIPVLYMSSYIIRNKQQYYHLLQSVREDDVWQDWLVFMLKAVSETAKETIVLINDIKQLMLEYKHQIRNKLPKIYSQELINNLFKHPYTKIDFVMQDVGVSRITATKYLDLLTSEGFVHKSKVGVRNYYVNAKLFELLAAN